MKQPDSNSYVRSDIVRYLEQVQASLREEREAVFCQMNEYSDDSEDTIEAVLQLSEESVLGWRAANPEVEGVGIEIVAGLGSRRLGIGIELKNNRCHRFEISWIVP